MALVDIARMTSREKLDLIGELWDSLNAADIVLTPAQEAELARRMESFDADIKNAKPWAEIKAERDKQNR